METTTKKRAPAADDRGAVVQAVRVSGYPAAKVSRLLGWDAAVAQRLLREDRRLPQPESERDRLLRENHDLRRALSLSIGALEALEHA